MLGTVMFRFNKGLLPLLRTYWVPSNYNCGPKYCMVWQTGSNVAMVSNKCLPRWSMPTIHT